MQKRQSSRERATRLLIRVKRGGASTREQLLTILIHPPGRNMQVCFDITRTKLNHIHDSMHAACSIDSIIILHVLVLDLGVVGAHKREAPAPIYSGRLVLTYQTKLERQTEVFRNEERQSI